MSDWYVADRGDNHFTIQRETTRPYTEVITATSDPEAAQRIADALNKEATS